MPYSDLFFSDENSFAVQQHQRAALESEIARIDGNRLLNINVEDLVTSTLSTNIGAMFRFSTKPI
jgi:hypothetical protein